MFAAMRKVRYLDPFLSSAVGFRVKRNICLLGCSRAMLNPCLGYIEGPLSRQFPIGIMENRIGQPSMLNSIQVFFQMFVRRLALGNQKGHPQNPPEKKQKQKKHDTRHIPYRDFKGVQMFPDGESDPIRSAFRSFQKQNMSSSGWIWVWLKMNQEGQTAGSGPCFHLPGFHFGTGFLSHSHMILC